MQTFDTLKRRVMAKIGKAIALQTTDEELEQAINEAIDDVRTEMPYHVSPDESITMSEDTYEYDISALDFAYIHRVTVADSEGDFPVTNVVPSWQWYLLPGPILKFDERMFDPLDGRGLRIEGQSFQDSLSLGSDVCYISDAYVVARAAASLLGNVQSPRESTMLRMAEDARQRSPFRPYPNSNVVRT